MIRTTALALLFALAVSASHAQEIEFLEEFALSADRSAALSKLIPGTEEHYFFTALQHQHEGQFEAVEELLDPWIKQYGRTERVRTIQNRQALLRYGQDPEGSLEYLKRELGLRFDHKRDDVERSSGLPSFLDPAAIGREALTRRALQRHRGTLDGFEDRALGWLVARNLNKKQRHHLLSRISRPDHPGIVALILADLAERDSRGFGSLQIHGRLLIEQLDMCARENPRLLDEASFVYAYLKKLAPSDDVDIEHDAEAKEAYLNRLWKFVEPLAASFNSLKTHVLYQRLLHDQSRGTYDRQRFLAYLALPRRVPYAEKRFLRRAVDQGNVANVSADFSAQTGFAPTPTDEPLVRDYLKHFFADAEGYRDFARTVDDTYLKELFAEVKILAGSGDQEQWYSWISPRKYEQLKKRVDLEFVPSNKTHFRPEDDVTLELYVKNVPKLFVKVFEINTPVYYRVNDREIDTDINLEGLVANVERVFEYEDSPLRRVLRRFEFPELSSRGVYVAEFIGNGKSSRALIRKGRLQFVERSSVAGHVFTLLDQQGDKIEGGSVWFGAKQYPSDEDGTITVPYSTNPGLRNIVLQHKGFASLDRFSHRSENYALVSGIYVDRESLIGGGSAEIAIRPSLRINGSPATVSILENVRVRISTTDRDGVSTTKVIEDVELSDENAFTTTIAVPDRLASLSVRLEAQVQSISLDEPVDLNAGTTIALNGIDATDKIEALHLSRSLGGYAVDLLGKAGERRSTRPVRFEIKHRDFTDALSFTLRTNDAGRIELGSLDDIAWVSALSPAGVRERWTIEKNGIALPQVIHALTGEPVRVAVPPSGREPRRSDFSLLELRRDSFSVDRFDNLSLEPGFLVLTGLAPGDYDLRVKDADRSIRLRITEGRAEGPYLVSSSRLFQVRNSRPLQITGIEDNGDELRIDLEGATDAARVHIYATRYQPTFSPFSSMNLPDFELLRWRPVARGDSYYLSGRKIGDEYRYILERKYARKFPGNMLDRPPLLLNPWEVRSTETTTQQAREGEVWQRSAEPPALKRELSASFARLPAPPSSFANLDFLPEGSVVLLNLRPDGEGRVTLDKSSLGDHQQIHILAVDPFNTVYRQHLSKPPALSPRELRLAEALDAREDYGEQRLVSLLEAGQEIEMNGGQNLAFETYDTIGKAYALYVTLTANAHLAEFSFVVDWPDLGDEEKREKYSKYACHELNFYLFHKDFEFFENTIEPYLANKKNKTFLDRWLLGEPLDDFVKPWAYGRLNTFEQILLAKRIEAEAAATAQFVSDRNDLILPDEERLDRLFDTAVQIAALDRSMPSSLLADRTAGMAGNLAFAADEDSVVRLGARSKMVKKATVLDGIEEAFGISAATAKAPAETAEAGAALGGKLKELRSLGYLAEDDVARRGRGRRLYRKLEKTKEWAENNYYKLPLAEQTPELIRVNDFWVDYARHAEPAAFTSVHFAQASGNFHEMMMALALLDLPFEAEPPELAAQNGAKVTLKASSRSIVFHREVKAVEAEAGASSVLVSQNFFPYHDRYRYEGNRRMDHFISDEFLVETVYGCQVVVTNPTSAEQRLQLLLQIPQGAVPVLGSRYTKSQRLALPSFNTQTFEFYFYFPAPGDFAHYPVHVTRGDRQLAKAEAIRPRVVLEATNEDTSSWHYISQRGDEAEVLAFLTSENLGRVNLDRIAWRLGDRGFFDRVVALLSSRHFTTPTIWSYGIRHNRPAAIQEFLRSRQDFIARCGYAIESPLLDLDPVRRGLYEHLEYDPLVNARVHPLRGRTEILNRQFAAQYRRFMEMLVYRRHLTDADRIAVVYAMLLQDRIAEAVDQYDKIDSGNLDTRLQYDYLTAYLSFYSGEYDRAREIAERYEAHPVARWKNRFRTVLAQLDEVRSGTVGVTQPSNQLQTQTQLASLEPSFEFKIEDGSIRLQYRNLESVRINYYLMDVELLFSRSPFVQRYSEQFSVIQPNRSDSLDLEAREGNLRLDLPEEFANANVVVEIEARGIRKSQPYFSHSLDVQTSGTYGQLRVAEESSAKPIPRAYVKAYARYRNGSVRFYKDGYTDLRGRFDYASLNTDELDSVEKFALLIMSEEFGALVKEIDPPRR